MTKTYKEIANSYALWREYADPSGFDSEAEFDAKSEGEKMAFLVSCFGPDEVAS